MIRFRSVLAFALFALIFGSVSAAAAAQSSEPDQARICRDESSALSITDYLQIDGVESVASVDRYGVKVMPDEAARLDGVAELRDTIDIEKLRTAAVSMFGDDLIAVTWSPVEGAEFRVTSGTEHSAKAADLAGDFRLGEKYRVVELVDGMSETARLTALGILREPKNLDLLDQLGVGLIETDELCGRLLVYTRDGNSALVSREVAGIIGTDAGLEVRELGPDQEIHLAAGRTDFTPSQSGGLRYSASTTCTSNVPWYSGTQFYLLTAGHCVDQATWSSRPNDWNGAWWTAVTSSVNLKQGGITVANSNATIRFGGELDVAVWPANGNVSTFLARTLTNTTANSPAFHNFGWWQWSPTWITNNSGGDAVGDLVCQSGDTQAFKTPNSGTSILTCSMLLDRDVVYGNIPGPGQQGSWFWALRATGQVHQNVCQGDSGGPVWRGGWLSGVVHGGQIRTESTPLAGRACWRAMLYSHVGYIKNAFGLTAPATFW